MIEFLVVQCFFNVVNRSLSFFIFSHQMCFIIWVLLIVLSKINSCLTHCCSFLEFLNQNLNLKLYQMNFWFEFLDIHMNEKTITYYDCHGFKWKNINIYPILTIFLCGLTFFLARWIKWLHPCCIPNVMAWPFKDCIVCISIGEMGPYIVDISSLPLSMWLGIVDGTCVGKCPKSMLLLVQMGSNK